MSYDARRVPCPSCGARSVISSADCLVEVGPNFAGFVYGDHVEVLPLHDWAVAKCNSFECGWLGTVGEAREAAGMAYRPEG